MVKSENFLFMDMILQALSRKIWKHIDDTEVDSLLDLGCGFGFHISFPRAGYKIGLDIHEPSLRYAKERYDDVVLADIRMLPIRLQLIDRISMMEVVEHLDKQSGEGLLRQVSQTNVLLTTPLDFYSWMIWYNLKGDLRHKHLSHWTCKSLERFGFKIHVKNFDFIRRLIFQTRGIIVARSKRSFPGHSVKKPRSRIG